MVCLLVSSLNISSPPKPLSVALPLIHFCFRILPQIKAGPATLTAIASCSPFCVSSTFKEMPTYAGSMAPTETPLRTTSRCSTFIAVVVACSHCRRHRSSCLRAATPLEIYLHYHWKFLNQGREAVDLHYIEPTLEGCIYLTLFPF